jgi:hypothetical protein
MKKRRPDLPRIIEQQVDRLSIITDKTRADLFLAARKLFALHGKYDYESLMMVSLALENYARAATTVDVTVTKLAEMTETFVAMDRLKMFDKVIKPIMRKINWFVWKNRFRTLFGLLPWIDEKTKNWWKLN